MCNINIYSLMLRFFECDIFGLRESKDKIADSQARETVEFDDDDTMLWMSWRLAVPGCC